MIITIGINIAVIATVLAIARGIFAGKIHAVAQSPVITPTKLYNILTIRIDETTFLPDFLYSFSYSILFCEYFIIPLPHG